MLFMRKGTGMDTRKILHESANYFMEAAERKIIRLDNWTTADQEGETPDYDTKWWEFIEEIQEALASSDVRWVGEDDEQGGDEVNAEVELENVPDLKEFADSVVDLLKDSFRDMDLPRHTTPTIYSQKLDGNILRVTLELVGDADAARKEGEGEAAIDRYESDRDYDRFGW